MYSQIYTYTLIRCLYNKGEDYIDSFYPLIVNILPLDKSGLSLEQIQERINQKFNLLVPIHSLSIIATRAKRKSFIERKERNCYLTEKGVNFVSELESERDELRRINEFVEEAKYYLLKNYDIIISSSEIESIIEKVIKENLDLFGSFLEGANHSSKSPKDIGNTNEAAIIDYLFYVEKSRPGLFKTLQDIIIGGIISSIVYRNNLEEPEKKLDRLMVFFDSNYLFSLLGLRYAEQNKPAKELFELIKSQSNIELKIFDFTVDEIANVLKKYQHEQYNYPAGIKIDSLYSSLKAHGWTSADIKEFIVNIESRLNKLGIKVFSTPIEIDKYKSDLDRLSALEKYKTEQGIKEQNHDLAAIEQIIKLRKSRKKKIENCEALFLTSDLKLSRFNYIEDKHKDNGTISEVIPDKLFTNLLWLKNPTHNNEIRLSSWLSLNTRHLFIDRSVWKTFYDNLMELKNQGKISDTDISILIYDNHIQEILKDTDPSDIHNIETEWITDSILKAKERLDLKQENEMKKLGLFMDEELDKSKREVELILQEKINNEEILKSKLKDSDHKYSELEKRNKQKDQSILEAILHWKKEQEIQSEIIAKRYLNIFAYSTLLLTFIVLLLISNSLLQHWNIIEPIAYFVSLGIAIAVKILGKKYDPFHLHFKIYDSIFNTVYTKKLSQIKEFERNLPLNDELL